MKAYNKLYQELFFKGLDKLRGRRNIERLKFLRMSQYWGTEQLERWQLTKLNQLLENAKKYSSFYSKRLSDNRLPLKSLQELESIPIFKKADMRNDINEILCNNVSADDCELSRTGGSTGEPSYYYLDNSSKDWNRGSVYRSAEWADVHLGDKTVMMMGSHYDYKEFQKLKVKTTLFLQRYKDLSVAHVNDSVLERYYKTVMKFKPTSIWGYSSGLYLFAKYIEKNHPNAKFDFIRALITSSETLQAHWRKKMNTVYGENKVFDHYGSREVYVASECKKHNGYHIHAENIILEIVDKDGKQLPDGQLGRILITDLNNMAFPFIRYEIGDVGNKSLRKTCGCGINLPLLERIEGRMGDIIVLKNRVLTPPNFTILMSDLEGVDSYQIIQKKIDGLVVKIVKNSKYDKKVENYIIDSIRDLSGDEVKIDIDYVSEIPVPLSGKHRFIISEVSDIRNSNMI